MSKLPRPFNDWTTYKGHLGFDYPVPDNTFVKASGNGVVTFSGYVNERAGYGVTVEYDNGQVWAYRHSDKNDWRAKVGTRVSLGTNIMQVGKTGKFSTGYHLHHEVYVRGVIQMGDDYWKFVDKSSNGYIGAGSSSGDNVKPLPIQPIKKLLEDDMLFLYTDDGSGKRKVWILLNVNTAKFIFTDSQARANNWAQSWGPAREVERLSFLNAIDAIKKTM